MGLPDQSDMHPTDRLDSYAMNKDQRLYTQAASALAERRKSPRTAIHRPAYINFEPYNRGGVITDISETGLRFHTVDTLEQGGIVRVSIFLGAAGHIEVVGELMWKDATQRIGGLRFTVLPAGAADQIRVWAEASNGAEVSGADISGMPPLPAENREAPASNLASSQLDAAPVANNGASERASQAELPDLPQTTQAQAPDPHALGMTEAVFDYCAKADPKGAAKVGARLKRLVQGASRETLAEVRKSDAYRKARSSVDDFVAKVDERNASRVCSGPLAASK